MAQIATNVEEKTDEGMDNGLGTCLKCNKLITKKDSDWNNVHLQDNEFVHKNCKKTTILPSLADNELDVFNPLTSSAELLVDVNMHKIKCLGNGYHIPACGLLSISKGIKTWHLQINKYNSYTAVGIIESQQAKKYCYPFSKDAYTVYSSGELYNRGQSTPSFPFRENDIISIVLNVDKNSLYFLKNNNALQVVPEVDVKGKSWTLLVSMYYKDVEIEIINNPY